MGTKIDRRLDVVLRERTTPDESPSLGKGSAGILGLIVLAASVAAWRWVGPWAALGLGAGVVLMRAGALRTPLSYRTVIHTKRVQISEEGIRPAGDRFIPRDEIAQALFQPRTGGRPTVRCLGRSQETLFEVEVEDEEEGEELLSALGKDASHVRTEFRVASPHANGVAGIGVNIVLTVLLFIAGCWLAGATGFAAAMVPWAAMVAWLVSLNLNQIVEVGVDGVLVRWAGRRRFIPFEDIGSGKVTEPGCFELELRNGKTWRVWASERNGHREAVMQIAALASRFYEARRAYLDGARAVDLATYVARGEREIAEWRAELTRLHDPETRGGYRVPGARGEDLWRVVEDTTAPEDARAGAAIALRNEAGAHPRLRVAAEAVASPRLRVALERAADPEAEEAALDEALEAFARERS